MNELSTVTMQTQLVTQNKPMEAVVRASYGEAEVLTLGTIARPTIGATDLLVRVHAAGLTRGDWHLMTGKPYLMRVMGFGFSRPANPVLGLEVAGTVVEVGAKVTRFKVGDEVFGIGQGTFAEYTCAKEGKLAKKPVGLSFEQAAVLGISGVTAMQSVCDVAKVGAGQRVLVIGASGGVGTFVVQLCKSLGAQVTGVCSTAKVDLVRALGADQVLDYTQTDFAEQPERYDVIFDLGGSSPVARLKRALVPDGTVVFIGGENEGNWIGSMSRQMGAALTSMFSRQKCKLQMPNENAVDLERLAAFVDKGALTPALERSYRLAEVPDAMRHLVEGRVRGKIAIAIGG
jgi:NADPH:quinone reductase-like Zn-dependent oxidoreductase